ncbi:Homocysteine-responsive endoplasmic reticulum-resident ubiquitin-like domain member 1 protein [Nowakowskiella sp. JEL0407]|nr:Homocysteine-responsive endoplasmic reticulum-resident ubiquitin-like domain member 1 protein [Nowakowskiella sp. JEL0407]
MSVDNENLVRIRIKCPVHFNEEFSISISSHHNISELKSRLSDEFPLKPSHEDQRIIFSGKLLADTDVIRDVLSKVDLSTDPTFHLVLRTNPSSNLINNSIKPSSDLRTPVASTSTAPQIPTQQTIPAKSTTTFPSVKLSDSILSEFPFLDELNRLNIPYQIVNVNGVLCALHPQIPPNIQPTEPSPPTTTTNESPEPQNNNPPPPQRDQPAQPAQPAAAPVPAPPDEFGDNARAQNAFWLAVKLLIIVSLFSTGASIERKVFLHITAIVIFMLQTRRIQWILRYLPNGIRLHQIQPGNPQGNAETDVQQTDQPEQPQIPNSMFAEIRAIIYSFIVSLIPEPYEAVAV